MGKIDELIQQYCPDGVERVRLGDAMRRMRGTPITAAKMKEVENEDGDIRIFAGGKTVVNAFEKDIPNANIIRVPALLVQSRGVIDVVYYDQPFTFKNEMWAYTCDSKITVKFLHYYLKGIVPELRKKAVAMGAFPQISIPDTDNLQIPLPPMEVQKAIVEVLDKFDSYAAELQAELQARKAQYEYYRNKLLSEFPEGVEVKEMTLGEICSVITDGAHSSPASVEQGYFMPSVKDMRPNGFDFSDCKKISKADFEYLERNGCRPQIGDVLIAKDGSMLKYAFPIEESTNYVILSSIAILRPIPTIITPKFLAHYFRQETIKQYVIREHSSKGGVPRIILKNFKRIKILVPPLAEQERIVAILDKFEALVNDLSQGLPAEIEAVKQQYEYYRNKLLTF